MIELSLIKKHLSINSSFDDGSDDVLLESFAAAALEYAESDTGVSFIKTEKTVVLDGFPAGAIELLFTPIIEVVSVSYTDPSGHEQEIDPQTLRLDSRSRVYPLLYPPFTQGWPAAIAEPESVTIALQVGYDVLPAKALSACLLLIGHLYEHREAVTTLQASELPMGVNLLLSSYRIPRVG